MRLVDAIEEFCKRPVSNVYGRNLCSPAQSLPRKATVYSQLTIYNVNTKVQMIKISLSAFRCSVFSCSSSHPACSRLKAIAASTFSAATAGYAISVALLTSWTRGAVKHLQAWPLRWSCFSITTDYINGVQIVVVQALSRFLRFPPHSSVSSNCLSI